MSTHRMNLIAYLQTNHVWLNVLEKRSTVHTAEAAAATDLPLQRVIESLVLTADGEPVITIIPGTCRVDKDKLKATLGVRKVQIVSFAEAEQYSGYPPGTTPPVFHKKISKVVMDQRVMQFDTVYGGGGSRQKLVELKPVDIRRLNNALVANITKEVM